MHLDGILREHQFSVIFNSEFVESEEAEVAEDHVHCDVVPVGSHRVSLEEYFYKHLKELFVPGATVENLFDEYLLIWVL